MIDLVETAYELQGFLREHQRRFCFIGGLAVQHWGEPRLTVDVDLTVLADYGAEAGLIDALLARYPARIDGAREFALARRVLLLRGQNGIDIDLALGALAFEVGAVDRAIDVEMQAGRNLRLCTAEDLIVYKAFADRPRDWLDVETILHRQGPGRLDWAHIDARLSELAALKEQPELLTRLHRLRDSL